MSVTLREAPPTCCGSISFGSQSEVGENMFQTGWRRQAEYETRKDFELYQKSFAWIRVQEQKYGNEFNQQPLKGETLTSSSASVTTVQYRHLRPRPHSSRGPSGTLWSHRTTQFCVAITELAAVVNQWNQQHPSSQLHPQTANCSLMGGCLLACEKLLQ